MVCFSCGVIGLIWMLVSVEVIYGRREQRLTSNRRRVLQSIAGHAVNLPVDGFTCPA